MSKRLAILSAAVTAGLSATSISIAQVPVVDGTLDAAYGGAAGRFATQTVNTGFGDNQSELDAGYSKIVNGKLYIFLAGNLESNFNKMVFFFDTRAGGQNVILNNNPGVAFNALNERYAGMTFDTGFEPDYFFTYDRSSTEVFLKFSELNTNGGGFGGDLGSVMTPNPNQQGMGTVGGTNGFPSVEFGYDDSNTAGILGVPSDAAADQVAAQAVMTGSEIAIDLTAIGATENFTMMIGINGSSHDYWSNQFLPGLTPPQGNLGSDGLGNGNGTVALVNFNNIAGNQFLTVTYHAPLSHWSFAAGGSWSEAAKWSGDGVPNAPDARAFLDTTAGNVARVITLDVPVKLALLTFEGTGGYTVNGSAINNLTMTSNGATPGIQVNSGNHTINAPLVLATTANFTIADGSQLTVAGPMTATGQTIVKNGLGTLQVPNVRGNGIFIGAGTVKIAPNGTDAGTSKVLSLTINGGVTPTAKLDITNNGFVVDYTPPPPGPEAEPFDTIRAQIAAGYNGGGVNAWTGNGITTSNGNGNNIGIGYAEASELFMNFPAMFMGQTVDDNSAVLFRETRYGDADLNGTVNLADFNRLAGNFGVGTIWTQGDFNYDGMVNLTDFNLLAANFGLSAGPDGPTPEDWAALAAVVPEPSMGLALSGALASAAMSRFSRRRRRA